MISSCYACALVSFCLHWQVSAPWDGGTSEKAYSVAHVRFRIHCLHGVVHGLLWQVYASWDGSVCNNIQGVELGHADRCSVLLAKLNSRLAQDEAACDGSPWLPEKPLRCVDI